MPVRSLGARLTRPWAEATCAQDSGVPDALQAGVSEKALLGWDSGP